VLSDYIQSFSGSEVEVEVKVQAEVKLERRGGK